MRLILKNVVRHTLLNMMLFLAYIMSIISAQAQTVHAPDAAIIESFLNDLEIQGCPPVVDPSRPITEWYGLTLALDQTGKVTELSVHFDLIFKNITCATIPASINTLHQLTALKTLRFVNLGIQYLPNEINSLDNIETLDLHHNHLTQLPSALNGMAALKTIDLSYNDFSVIAPEILALDQLKSINLSHNHITGTVPTAIWPTGNTPPVALDFSYNNMSGAVAMPPDYKLISQLNLTNNHFTLADLDVIDVNWPYQNATRALRISSQSVGSRTMTPANGTTVNIVIENYSPEGTVMGWNKQDPATGFYTRVANGATHQIPSFDPLQHAGKYKATILRGMRTAITYGPVIVKGTGEAKAPSLQVSRPFITIRPGRPIDPVHLSFQDDFTAQEELKVSINAIPQHLDITSSLAQQGQYTLELSAKDPAWTGQEQIIVSVTDEDGLTTSSVITIEIMPGNNIAPVVKNIPEVFAYTQFADGSATPYYSMLALTLQFYVEDDYDEVKNMTVTLNQEDVDRLHQKYNVLAEYDGYSDINVLDIEAHTTRTVFEESLRFTIEDADGASSQGVIPIRFPASHNAPPAAACPDLYLVKGTGALHINLDDLIHDDFNKKEDLLIDPIPTSTDNFNIVLRGRMLEITPLTNTTNVFDQIMLLVHEPNYSFQVSQVPIRFRLQENTAPLISVVPEQTVELGSPFPNIRLPDIIFDDKTPPELIQWMFTGQHHLKTTVTNGVLTVTATDPAWRGTETITFLATDSEGKTDKREVVFGVYSANNTAPVVNIDAQYVKSIEGFTPIDLLLSVQDDNTLPQNITWTIDSSLAPDLLVIQQDNVVTITPRDSKWRGINTIRFVATDAEGWSGQAYVKFGVDFAPPVVQPIPETIGKPGVFALYVDLHNYIIDDVTPFKDLFVDLVSIPKNFSAFIDYYETPIPEITLMAYPDAGWIGSESIQLKVVDRDGLETTFSVTLTIAGNTYTVLGVAKDQKGVPLAGVTVSGFGNAVVTNVNGEYNVTVPEGRTLTITPAHPSYTFNPASHTITTISSNQSVNFIGTYVEPQPKTYTIAGIITDDSGQPVKGVSLKGLLPDVVTNANGEYSITAKEGNTLTITPSLSNYTFNPAHYTITSITGNQIVNFTATYHTPEPEHYTISGLITDGSGQPVKGVTINGLLEEITTDASGQYNATVPNGWTGTITPSLQNYTFSPTEIIINPVHHALPAQNFTASMVTAIETTESKASVYPNPSRGRFNIVFYAPARAIVLQVITTTGTVIQQHNISPTIKMFDMIIETPGMYFIKIIEGETHSMQKVIIH